MSSSPSEGPLRVLVGMPLAGLEGGAERLLVALLENADVAGLDIHLVCFEDGPLVQIARDCGQRSSVVAVEHHNSPTEGLRAIRAVREVIREENPDVVLSWLARAHFWLAPAAVSVGMRRSLVWWQYHIARGERLEAVIALLPTAGIIACSAAAATAQEARRPHRRCAVVHPGIDDPPRPPQADLDRLREQLGLPGGRPVVGTVGRLVRWKGQHNFIASIAALRDSGQDVTALVVGGENYGIDAGYAAELEALARSHDLGDRVVFTGHVDNPLDHIALMDVLVSASDGEPFGVTLLEAMAFEIPVVAVARGGPLEIVVDGETGVLAPDDTGPAIAAAMERVLADPELAARCGAAGRERFLSTFTAERMAIEAARTLRALAPSPVAARV